MKYQIYLNKRVSEIIEKLSEAEGMKPASLIKKFIEGTISTLERNFGDEVGELLEYGERTKV